MTRPISFLAAGFFLLPIVAKGQEPPAADPAWKKHVIQDGFATQTAVAADFTGDGHMDIIASNGGKVRLFAGPDWKDEHALYVYPKINTQCIHVETFDVDGDGDPDYLGANSKGPVFWLENPGGNIEGLWTYRIVDDHLNGIHCLLKADVNADGQPDLLVNNFEPEGPLGDSLTWQQVPDRPLEAKTWLRNVFAPGDAPGGSHYFGFGDVDGDGDGDIACGAKGDPFQGGNWFAWWKNPGGGGAGIWEKEIIAEGQAGATNILPADVNGDGVMDFIASRGHGQGVLWFEGPGPEWVLHDIQPEIVGPHSLTVSDLDGDGDMDAATCGKESQWVMWYENDGLGNFALHLIDAGQMAYDIRSTDLDGDGDLDLLLAGHRSKNVVWYENPLK